MLLSPLIGVVMLMKLCGGGGGDRLHSNCMWAHHTARCCCLRGESDTPMEPRSNVLLHPVVLQAKCGEADDGRAVLTVLT